MHQCFDRQEIFPGLIYGFLYLTLLLLVSTTVVERWQLVDIVFHY